MRVWEQIQRALLTAKEGVAIEPAFNGLGCCGAKAVIQLGACTRNHTHSHFGTGTYLHGAMRHKCWFRAG